MIAAKSPLLSNLPTLEACVCAWSLKSRHGSLSKIIWGTLAPVVVRIRRTGNLAEARKQCTWIVAYNFIQLQLTMHPSTPSKKRSRATSVDRVPDTIKRSRFFEAWDSRQEGESLRSFVDHYPIARSTASDWLKLRDEIGDAAYRTTRRRSDKLGRKSKVSKELAKFIVSNENPYRKEPLEVNIEEHNIGVQPRQLRRRLKAEIDGGGSYLMVFTNTEYKDYYYQNRVAYGKEHAGKSIQDFWQYIIFTDEFHYNRSSRLKHRVLKERGYR